MDRTIAARPARLAKSREDRVVTGVCAGLGEGLGLDPTLVRIAFGILSFAGGLGVLLYVVLIVALPDQPAESVRWQAQGVRPVVALSLVVSGLLVGARTAHLWFGDGVVIPVALAGMGAGLIWTRAEGHRAIRITSGSILILGGLITFAAANISLYALPGLLVPSIATTAALTLVLGPWLARTWSQLAAERRERIRSEERASMAAHLHDSVLQTLALIQRSDSDTKMSSLARVQERELRAWLYGQAPGTGSQTLGTAMENVAGRVERMHEVKVELVQVGDAPLDEPLTGLVGATGEAVANAARHSGQATVSVYVEVEPALITSFIRDKGKGFEVGTVPQDRRGIRDSIVGRVERYGGRASIRSTPGEGTEVAIEMPRRVQ